LPLAHARQDSLDENPHNSCLVMISNPTNKNKQKQTIKKLQIFVSQTHQKKTPKNPHRFGLWNRIPPRWRSNQKNYVKLRRREFKAAAQDFFPQE
jgi:hypothetical protein